MGMVGVWERGWVSSLALVVAMGGGPLLVVTMGGGLLGSDKPTR